MGRLIPSSPTFLNFSFTWFVLYIKLFFFFEKSQLHTISELCNFVYMTARDLVASLSTLSISHLVKTRLTILYWRIFKWKYSWKSRWKNLLKLAKILFTMPNNLNVLNEYHISKCSTNKIFGSLNKNILFNSSAFYL